jgi:hypothetical protein
MNGLIVDEPSGSRGGVGKTDGAMPRMLPLNYLRCPRNETSENRFGEIAPRSSEQLFGKVESA